MDTNNQEMMQAEEQLDGIAGMFLKLAQDLEQQEKAKAQQEQQKNQED